VTRIGSGPRGAAAGAVGDVDLTDLDNFAAGFPHESFVVHRRQQPVAWHEPTEHTPDGEGFWSVATHAEALAVLRDAETYSSERGGGRALGGTTLQDNRLAGVLLSMMDDPRHAAIRGLLTRQLTPKMVGRLAEDARWRAQSIVARIPSGVEVDVVQDVAGELPLQLTCQLIGIPQKDRNSLWNSVDASVDIPTGDVRWGPSDDRQPALARLYEYTQDLLAAKRAQPGDDLTSIAVHATFPDLDPPAMTDAELYTFVRNLYSAGMESTRSGIAMGLLALIEHPDQLAAVRSDPQRWGTAVEELLRWTSPVAFRRRTVTTPTELGGQRLAPGDKVLVWVASANRDERVFEQPMDLDLSREPNPHLTLGFGVHYCLGAHLARLELRVMLEELATRFSRLGITRPPEWTRGAQQVGLRHLWLRLDS
jgi:cytochrome P450